MKKVNVLVILMFISSWAYAAGPGGGFAVSVKAEPVTENKLEDKIMVVGTLAANEKVTIKNEIDGYVKTVAFNEGQTVTEGDVLLQLDSDKLEASLQEAQAALDLSQTTFSRMENLVSQGAVSRQEYDQAKSTLEQNKARVNLLKAQLDDAVIRAPFTGQITERLVSPGQYISKDTVITSIVDDDPMKISFMVPERYLARLAIDQKVYLTVAAYGDKSFVGQVYFIDPQIDEKTRSVVVKAKVENPQGELRQGMFARLAIVLEEIPNALLIPETALISNGDSVMVFTIDKEQKAQMAFIQVGMRSGNYVQVLKGLNKGDMVITEGFQKIGPGSPVSVFDPKAQAAETSKS